MTALTDTGHSPRRPSWARLGFGFVTWIAAYASLMPFADAAIKVLDLSRQAHLGEAVHFFFYDTPKILLLLTGIVFLMGVVHTFVSPERTRALLSGKRLGATFSFLISAPSSTVRCRRISWPRSWAGRAVVVAAGCGAARRADVQQCRRHPDRRFRFQCFSVRGLRRVASTDYCNRTRQSRLLRVARQGGKLVLSLVTNPHNRPLEYRKD